MVPPGDRTLRGAMRPRPIGRILITSGLLLGLAGLGVVDVTAATPATRPTAGAPASRSRHAHTDGPVPHTGPLLGPGSRPRPHRDGARGARRASGARPRVPDHGLAGAAGQDGHDGHRLVDLRLRHAQASTLQVSYLPRARHVSVDNVASAWSRCRGCQATALSVQVILLGRTR